MVCAASIFELLLEALPEPLDDQEASLIHWSIARRYARALFESVGNDFDRAAAELKALAESFVASPEIAGLLDDPTLPKSQKKAFAERTVVAGNFNPMVGNLIRLLAERDRLGQLVGISLVFSQLADEQAGRIRTEVTTAVPLRGDTHERLQKALESATKKKVEITFTQDASILGGMVATVGSTVYDGSLRTQLETMRRDLAGRA